MFVSNVVPPSRCAP